MAKKPVESEEVTGASEVAEVPVGDGIEFLPPDGFTLIATAELDELKRLLKMSR
jgi:hypothetical protein